MTTESHKRYAVDYDWYEVRNRSLATALLTRLCPSCREERVASDDVEALAATIVECCAQNRGFITQYTPIREAVFRLLLAWGNQPLSAAEICDELRGRMAFSLRTATLTPESIARLLDNDNYYGIRPVAEAAVAEPEEEAA